MNKNENYDMLDYLVDGAVFLEDILLFWLQSQF